MTQAAPTLSAAQGWARPFAIAALFAALATRAAEDIPPPPPLPEARTAAPPASTGKPAGKCLDCAVIRSIRTIETERNARREMPTYMTSSQYLDTRRYSQPFVGPYVGFTFGPGQSSQGVVGAAGNPAMRQRMLEITYEIALRFDDGRYSLIEQSELGALREGDRVRVVDNRVQLAPKE